MRPRQDNSCTSYCGYSRCLSQQACKQALAEYASDRILWNGLLNSEWFQLEGAALQRRSPCLMGTMRCCEALAAASFSAFLWAFGEADELLEAMNKNLECQLQAFICSNSARATCFCLAWSRTKRKTPLLQPDLPGRLCYSHLVLLELLCTKHKRFDHAPLGDGPEGPVAIVFLLGLSLFVRGSGRGT